jgi:hypothetical protein
VQIREHRDLSEDLLNFVGYISDHAIKLQDDKQLISINQFRTPRLIDEGSSVLFCVVLGHARDIKPLKGITSEGIKP